ncbi:MAG: nucleotide sugar dehydrogenase [Thermofilaceae archaeon]
MVSRDYSLAVYGLGYVGKAIASVMLRAGFSVIGVDSSENVVREVKAGIVKHVEGNVRETLLQGLRAGLFDVTMDGVAASRRCRVKLVTVPVYLTSLYEPDFSRLKAAAEAIGMGAEEGDLVIVESSVPPGTTMEVIKPALEEASGLRVEEELLLAYSPERIYIGRSVQDIEERYPKIVAGVGPRSTEAAKNLYLKIAKRGVIELSSPTAAELEKLAEGVYRDVNIALTNELAKLCTKLGIDYREVREAANSQPYCHLHVPGVGVGGYCIPVYPRFLMYVGRKLNVGLPLIELARETNLTMPSYTAGLVDLVVKELGLKEPKIVILGLAFRGGVDDTRFSPTYDLIDSLLKKGYSIERVHDPYVERDETLASLNILLSRKMEEAVKGTDVLVIATDHPEYSSLTLAMLKELSGAGKLGVVDGRLVLKGWREPPPGVAYVGIGRPLIKG